MKDGKELARKNGSMKNWLLQKTNPLQLSSVQEEDEAMEVDEMSMRESDVGVDHAKGQRLAKCKARQTEHPNKTICASLEFVEGQPGNTIQTAGNDREAR